MLWLFGLVISPLGILPVALVLGPAISASGGLLHERFTARTPTVSVLQAFCRRDFG